MTKSTLMPKSEDKSLSSWMNSKRLGAFGKIDEHVKIAGLLGIPLYIRAEYTEIADMIFRPQYGQLVAQDVHVALKPLLYISLWNLCHNSIFLAWSEKDTIRAQPTFKD